ncbi:MAG: DNA polymerase III subunit delta [Gammaproteobacteria bacterium]|nr:DNA polymerase III subunit delta [Gammaproteobacteria bacterium]
MKLPADRLPAELKKGLERLYVVSGDEPLLVQEACDLIRATLRENGFTEREVFNAEGRFDWEDVLFSANSMSLFAERRILEIRVPGGKPGDKGAKALTTYTQNMPDDAVMLLVMPRLDAASQRTKWFKAIDAAGVFVQVWPVSMGEMPKWIAERFRRAGLEADRDAINAMVERIEGNLLAAIQEIERLRLSSTDRKITLQHIVESVADSSRYDVFTLIDAAVSQDARRTLKIVQGLRSRVRRFYTSRQCWRESCDHWHQWRRRWKTASRSTRRLARRTSGRSARAW